MVRVTSEVEIQMSLLWREKRKGRILYSLRHAERMNGLGCSPRAFTPALRFLHCCEFFFFLFSERWLNYSHSDAWK